MNRKLILFVFIAFLTAQLTAQTITTNPEFPIPGSQLTLTFDAAGSDLEGYTGDLYVHTGVTIEGVGNWQHVIGSWNDNETQPQLTSLGADLWELEIAPSVNDFYSVDAGEVVTELCLVFRSSDGELQTPNDIFVNIYSAESLQITSPDSTHIFSVNDEVQISAVALFATEMTLYINETEITTVSSNVLSYVHTATLTDYNTIRITATNGTENSEEITRFFVREDNTIAELPSENLQDGINYMDDNTVTLVLYAPYKEFVFVKGSFNNWELEQSNQMKQTPDGNRYWLTINELSAGQEYIYQYVIDGELTIADPYCEKISDPWNDQYISDSTYPDLIDYPSGYISGIASVLQTAQEPYVWHDNDFIPPAKENMMIYELHIRDFIEAHDYSTLIDTLSYLKNLGINTVELMPVNEFEGNSSWGYNPSFYFAADKYYGPAVDLKAFIDSCHANDMAVIMDIVLNHSYGQSPFVQMYFDADAGEWGQPSPENPWYNEVSPNSTYSWGFDFNHESQATKDLVDRINTFWLTEYHFDGFRFDFTKGFTNTPGDGWAYDAARINILERMADEIWNVNENAAVILEHFAENSEEIELSDYGMMIWGNVTHSYGQASMGWTSEWDFSWVSHLQRGWNNPNLIGYMESHDEERMMFRNLNFGNSSGSYDIQELSTALDRAELASVFFLTIPGPKMIWQFEELGYDISIDEPCRVCEKPILWNYYTETNRDSLYLHFKKLLNLRTEYDIFTTSEFELNTSNAVKEIILTGDTMNMHIVGNFDVQTQTIIPTFASAGIWYECFKGTQLNAPQTLTLEPGEYRLYTDKKMQGCEYTVAPVAENVSYTGTFIIGDTLAATYSFTDENEDLEGSSIYQWYTGAGQNGAGTELISGANSKIFIITENEKDKFIAFGVTPVAVSEQNTTGSEVKTDFDGPVIGIEGLSVYPNPAENGKLIIVGADNYDVFELYNFLGRKVLALSTNNSYSLDINIKAIPTGLYLIKLSGASGNIVKRIYIVNN
ncbi:MAG: alpha-amylase family glycosyl hydrolase [Bacteroidota bacterium]|nr:alpha-amylase family glycosyl hydrolase [Bacteroidota bacterium]